MPPRKMRDSKVALSIYRRALRAFQWLVFPLLSVLSMLMIERHVERVKKDESNKSGQTPFPIKSNLVKHLSRIHEMSRDH